MVMGRSCVASPITATSTLRWQGRVWLPCLSLQMNNRVQLLVNKTNGELYNSKGHKVSDTCVTSLEKVFSSDTSFRKKREKCYTVKMNTKYKGMNRGSDVANNYLLFFATLGSIEWHFSLDWTTPHPPTTELFP